MGLYRGQIAPIKGKIGVAGIYRSIQGWFSILLDSGLGFWVIRIFISVVSVAVSGLVCDGGLGKIRFRPVNPVVGCILLMIQQLRDHALQKDLGFRTITPIWGYIGVILGLT